MPTELDHLRRMMPDLAHVDPLSGEVQDWLDRAYDEVKRVDEVEAIVFAMHRRYLLDPAASIVASAEIAEIIDRALRTRAILQRTRAQGRTAA